MVASMSEYCSSKSQRRALGQFTSKERPILLFTERFYFFKRYFVKLGEALVFYSPVIHEDFYVTLVGKLTTSSPSATVITLFGRYDTHELIRLVGTERATLLMTRASSAFSFVTN